MDKNIKQILKKLENCGFEAFLVGGYVRDSLLGIKSYDVDICTNARPRDLNDIFEVSVNNYGSVNLKKSRYNIDITTYRIDKKYVNRRPTEVEYIDSLEEDLKRRDFTINAIIMNKDEKIFDYFNGTQDINDKVIRMIGDVDSKLKDDPLRMLRAIRFATILNFEIADDLYMGIKNNCNLVGSLSKNRIKSELSKILISKNYNKGLELLDNLGISRVIGLTHEDIRYVNDLTGMWAQIKVSDIPFTNTQKSNIIKITEIVKIGYIDCNILFKYGLYLCTIAGLILDISPKKVNAIYKKMPIKSRNDIDIAGDEVVSLLKINSGKIVGTIYDDLINQILKGKLKNKKDEIKRYLLKRK